MKDRVIDGQVLALHRAMADKLLAEPQRKTEILARLEQRLNSGRLHYSGYIHWVTLLDLLDEPELFRASLLENSGRMRKLRRSTALVGLLTEEERQQALLEHACGETSIDTLY